MDVWAHNRQTYAYQNTRLTLLLLQFCFVYPCCWRCTQGNCNRYDAFLHRSKSLFSVLYISTYGDELEAYFSCRRYVFFRYFFVHSFFGVWFALPKCMSKAHKHLRITLYAQLLAVNVCGESCANVKRLIIGIAPLGKLLSFSQFPR